MCIRDRVSRLFRDFNERKCGYFSFLLNDFALIRVVVRTRVVLVHRCHSISSGGNFKASDEELVHNVAKDWLIEQSFSVPVGVLIFQNALKLSVQFHEKIVQCRLFVRR